MLVKEDGLERYLKYDNARRASFVDRFLADDVTLESVYDNKYEDLGDFSNNGYKSDIRAQASSCQERERSGAAGSY